jgi:hypothetical protein
MMSELWSINGTMAIDWPDVKEIVILSFISSELLLGPCRGLHLTPSVGQ